MATATPQQPSYPPVDGMAPVELDVEAAQPAAAAPAASSSRKRLRRISVGGLFAQQDWGSTLATLLLSAALGIVWVSRHAAVAGCDCGPPPARRLAPPASRARRPPLTIPDPSTPPSLRSCAPATRCAPSPPPTPRWPTPSPRTETPGPSAGCWPSWAAPRWPPSAPWSCGWRATRTPTRPPAAPPSSTSCWTR